MKNGRRRFPLSPRGTSGERVGERGCKNGAIDHRISPLPDPPHAFVVGRGNISDSLVVLVSRWAPCLRPIVFGMKNGRRLFSRSHEPDSGRDIALRWPRPRISGRHRCAAERGADGAARRPHHVQGFNARSFVLATSFPEGEGQGEGEQGANLWQTAAVSRNDRPSRVLQQSRRFRNLIMNSPTAALAWEIWRKNRFGFLLLFAFLILCLGLGRVAAHF